MSNTFKTEQEAFWAGDFGNDYVSRNRGGKLMAANLAMFAQIVRQTREVKSVIEFGANIGLNLVALGQLLPEAELAGIEINPKAVEELHTLPRTSVFAQSILDFTPQRQWDLVFTKGVLIHINPDELPRVYDLMYRSSSRYLMVAEYYNPSPMAIPYRGHSDRLFKRDFAGDLLERFPDLRLLDYGFFYKRDPNFAQDDISWFLLEK